MLQHLSRGHRKHARAPVRPDRQHQFRKRPSGQFGQTNYSAAKAGIIGFTKALALEGASRGTTVNEIAPGYTDTGMVRAVPAKVLEGIVAAVPVGRTRQARGNRGGILFLVAEDAGFITGATLSINGGKYLA